MRGCQLFYALGDYSMLMDFRRPMLAITPTLDGDVLATLARGDVELTGRELARRTGHGSPEGVRRAADRLVTHGIVLRRSVGGAHLYRLNRDHIAAPYVEGLANLRGDLIDRLRTLLATWSTPPTTALLFGSVSRGEATTTSDLDLLVIRPRALDPDDEPWRTQLLELQQRATAWTGNDARVVEYGEDELIAHRRDPVLREALSDGIDLTGTRSTLQKLLKQPANR